MNFGFLEMSNINIMTSTIQKRSVISHTTLVGRLQFFYYQKYIHVEYAPIYLMSHIEVVFFL